VTDHDAYESFDDLEAMILAAGGYVQASDDLRPRVLESARAQGRERRAQRWVRRVAVCVSVLAGLAATANPPLEVASIDQQMLLDAAGAQNASSAKTSATQPGDIGWGMVKAFTEFRRRQSSAFRL
jgi:hypothetical protein